MRRNRILKSVLCAGLVWMIGWSAVLPAFPAEVVYSWHTNDKTIALTFDDGPHPVYTPEILDILEEYGV